MRLLCTVVFLCTFFPTSARAQSPGGAWEVGFGPHVVYRENSSSTHFGGGVTLARRFPRLAVVLEASGTRRQGHNDWRAVGGPRLVVGTGGGPSFFVQALAGALIRQRETYPAVLPGVGVDVPLAGKRSVRFQIDAPIERAEGRTSTSVRGSVWLVF